MVPSLWPTQCWFPAWNMTARMQGTILRNRLRYIVKCRSSVSVNTLRPRQNGRHFADDIFKCIFVNENVIMCLRFCWNLFRSGRCQSIFWRMGHCEMISTLEPAVGGEKMPQRPWDLGFETSHRHMKQFVHNCIYPATSAWRHVSSEQKIIYTNTIFFLWLTT